MDIVKEVYKQAPIFKYIHEFFNIHLKLDKRVSPLTIRSYKHALKSFITYIYNKNNLSIKSLKVEHFNVNTVREYLFWLRDVKQLANTSIDVHLSSIKSFMRYCADQDILFSYQYLELSKIKRFSRTVVNQQVKYLTGDQIDFLLTIPDTATEKGRRNKFFMFFLYSTGMRISEILNLKLCHLKGNGSNFESLQILGKGNKVRYVAITPEASDLLNSYLDEFHPNRLLTDYLFFSEHYLNNIYDKERTKLSVSAVNYFLREYAKKAHEKDSSFPKHIHAHMFRHSLAMALVRSGASQFEVKGQLGHSSLATTEIYAHSELSSLRSVVTNINDNHKIKYKEQEKNDTFSIMCDLFFGKD